MPHKRPLAALSCAALKTGERRITKALAEARAHCAVQGAQLTEQRAHVLELLLRRDGAAKAYDLLADMQAAQANVAPMTVYRALDFLVEQGLVHKVAANSIFVVCSHEHHPHVDPVLLVCERCGNTTEWRDPALSQQVSALLAGSGFHSHGMEIKGRCGRCAAQDTRPHDSLDDHR